MKQTFSFGTMEYLDAIYKDIRRGYEFKAKTKGQAISWQKALRKKLIELLGGFPKESGFPEKSGLSEKRCALNPRKIEKEELRDFTRERIVITAERGIDVPIYVLTPKKVKPPYRVVIGLHGHSPYGSKPVVGLGQRDGHREFGAEFARRGFMVFAIEQRAFGDRMEEQDKKEGKGASCRQVAFKAMMMGKTLVGMRVWDVIRTIDYIETLDIADSNRIACAGASGGGMTTTFACALDNRIKAGVVSVYFNTFFDSIMSINHCECNYIPNLVKYAEMYEIAGLFAPKPLIIESAVKDSIFPVKSVRFAYGKLRERYKTFGAKDRLSIDIFNDEHRWSGAKSYDFIERWL